MNIVSLITCLFHERTLLEQKIWKALMSCHVDTIIRLEGRVVRETSSLLHKE